MTFQQYLPGKQLRPYIKRFIVSDVSDEQTYKVLPDTSVVMGFQYRGRLAYVDNTTEVPLTTSGITGIQTGFRLFKNSPATSSLLVVFTETGAASYFDVPLHELGNASLALDNFALRSHIDLFEDQLAAATTDQERIQLVEHFLLSRLQKPKVDPLVSLALEHIYQSNGTIRMTSLADKLCISQSPLEKRFRQLVGTSPKRFASIVRMKQAIAAFSTTRSLTGISLESGYFDQAHFIKDFKTFTGLTPTEFLRASPDL
ncbi:helix-turn-helix domain-containing protein [Spirosoma sp. KCTC 42546]|uniref:helix-turn-helix domain-containing protein n=1 Tax=Spirosoma sp. KCTC 42546 TaxID=2520506 RepID=UPI001159FBB4|nr:helix-turn-helix domain-containing protein [Spirosoma sp. KCTC 42546]QDK78905.1 helix-turn-helix domain-containing protein [Spirosoma sp. KCTC 42546]